MTVRYLSCIKCHRNDLSQHFRQCPGCGKPVCLDCAQAEPGPEVCLLENEPCDFRKRPTEPDLPKPEKEDSSRPWWKKILGL